MKDPKDNEVRRQAGHAPYGFVELIARPARPKSGKNRFEVAVLVDGDPRFTTPAYDLIETQFVFDLLEVWCLKDSPKQGVAG